MAQGDEEESEEEEDELTIMVRNPRHVKPEIATAEKLAAEKGTTNMFGEVRPKEHVEPVTSQEDITKD